MMDVTVSRGLAWIASLLALIALLQPSVAAAQFTGPSVAGREMTVAAANEARTGTYVSLTGRIAVHLRDEYYRFEDDSGEIRVEIREGLWSGREIGPQQTVRLLGEVDSTIVGTRYIWVKALDVVN
ncbi:MAG: NirD/YgiW/YdeI family stress tolerance protein [Pseudomonadota bacterium]